MRFAEPIFSNDSFREADDVRAWRKMRQTYSEFKANACLTEGDFRLPLRNADRADYSHALEVLERRETKRALTAMEEIVAAGMTLLRAVSALVSSGSGGAVIRGIEVGVREVEAGLKLGAQVQVLGCLKADSAGRVSLEPLALFKDRSAFLRELEAKLSTEFVAQMLWAVLGAAGTIFLGCKLYAWAERRKSQARRRL